MSLLNSPGKLGLLSHPSSFGADTASKYSFFGERKGGNLGDAMNLSEIKFSYVSGETYSLINRDLKLHNDSKVHYIGF